jgi:hypothetical protein
MTDTRRSTLFLSVSLILALTASACDSPSAPPASGLELSFNKISHEDAQLVAQMRKATEKYHDINRARADGYVDDGFGCVSDPIEGGMGWHLIRDDLHADPAIDPLMPELLLYEPDKNGKMKFVAVEYEVYQDDWHNAGNVNPPTLLGKEFEALVFDGIPPVYGLHVWLWEENPSGLLNDWNPKVRCPGEPKVKHSH